MRQSCLSEMAAVHASSKRIAENQLSIELKHLRMENTKLRSEVNFHEVQTQRLVSENENLNAKLKVSVWK